MAIVKFYISYSSKILGEPDAIAIAQKIGAKIIATPRKQVLFACLRTGSLKIGKKIGKKIA